MDGSMGSTIEKIKIQEHDIEVQLREKRTTEATLASTKRKVYETMSHVAKLKEGVTESNASADILDAELSKAQAHQWGLTAQIEASDKELRQLKIESEQGISDVWKRRNLLCNEVQKVSDQCDVWALFTKPKYIETTITLKKPPNENTTQSSQHEGILESAQRKRQSLLAERDRLLNEPDTGEEFIRIKNALRYSVEMATQNERE